MLRTASANSVAVEEEGEANPSVKRITNFGTFSRDISFSEWLFARSSSCIMPYKLDVVRILVGPSMSRIAVFVSSNDFGEKSKSIRISAEKSKPATWKWLESISSVKFASKSIIMYFDALNAS